MFGLAVDFPRCVYALGRIGRAVAILVKGLDALWWEQVWGGGSVKSCRAPALS